MPNTINIHRVEMWDHTTEVINDGRLPPYERIEITIHTEGRRQTIINLYQDVSCYICGQQLKEDDEWVNDNDKYAHCGCIAEHETEMNDWIDRWSERKKYRWTTTDEEV